MNPHIMPIQMYQVSRRFEPPSHASKGEAESVTFDSFDRFLYVLIFIFLIHSNPKEVAWPSSFHTGPD